MKIARYVVRAVEVEGRSVREVADAHGVSVSWLYELVAAIGLGERPAWRRGRGVRFDHRRHRAGQAATVVR
jgi:transposase